MAAKFKHVHIGCGRLGLGLIGDAIRDVKSFAPSILLNRDWSSATPAKLPSSRSGREAILRLLKRNKRYLVSITKSGRKRRHRIVKINSLCAFPKANQSIDAFQACGQALDAVADPATRLITTAVGEKGLSDVGLLLAEGLRRRTQSNSRSAPPLYVLACENLKKGSEVLEKYVIDQARDGELVRFIGNGVFFCNTVVDRICTHLGVCKDRNDVEVHTEPYWDWIVERKRGGATDELEEVFGLSSVQFVNNIDPFEKRKAWLVNGVHLALATLAVNKFWGDPSRKELNVLKNALCDNEIGPKLELYQADVAQALAHVFEREKIFTHDELMDFNKKVRERILDSDDTIDRIVRELLELTNMESVIVRTARQIYNDLIDKNINFAQPRARSDFTVILKMIEAPLVKMLEDIELSSFFRKVNARLSEPVDALISLLFERRRKKGGQRVGQQALLVLLGVLNVIGNVYSQQIKILKHGRFITSYLERIFREGSA